MHYVGRLILLMTGKFNHGIGRSQGKDVAVRVCNWDKSMNLWINGRRWLRVNDEE
jgi:hypothetical protein